jgi:hypothetical protein
MRKIINQKFVWLKVPLLATASDKVYQLFAHGRWFSPGTPASSTTKTGRHDIAEILLKVALKHKKSIKLNILKDSLSHLGPSKYLKDTIDFNKHDVDIFLNDTWQKKNTRTTFQNYKAT